uniref:Ovule protein n=1 Tax=Toxocara canis TaxID=6265 RepID=A0A183U7B5_TOXCA
LHDGILYKHYIIILLLAVYLVRSSKKLLVRRTVSTIRLNTIPCLSTLAIRL